MQCKEVNKLLSDYQDGRLTPKDQEEVSGHMQTCGSCRNNARLFLEVWNLLNVIEPVDLSPNFRARFWQRIEEGESAKQGWRTGAVRLWNEWAMTARPAFASASVLVVAILGTLFVLKVLPKASVSRDISPILQWAQSAPNNLMMGGL